MRPSVRSPWLRLTALAVLAAFALACASTNLPPISATGSAFTPLADEVALWESSREEEAKLLEKVRLYDDPALERYLAGIVDELQPPGMAANREVRTTIHVVADPTLNAFAYPHGSLYIHTGLLARLDNEAQLATVLGHEMTHVDGRHMLRHQRAAQNREIGFTIASIAASVIIAEKVGDLYWDGHWGEAAAVEILANVIAGLGLELAFIAAVNGYGRELEREADAGGLTRLRLAGYDTAQAPKVYEALLDDHGEPPAKVEAFFFGSHPNLKDRIARTEEALRTQGPVAPGSRGLGDQREFALRMRTVARDDARLNLELGRLELAESELARARRELPGDAETQFLVGMLARARAATAKDAAGRDAHLDDAATAFTQALGLDPGHAEAHRELGQRAYDRGDRRSACSHFAAALRSDRDLPGADRIEDLLDELDAAGDCR